jgi:NAD(P)-dependent dehydrogenase (short-subunit alcohol dehydrogenase family)
MTNVNRGAAIVTGGSRGIGAAIAKMLGANGYSVAFNYVSDEASARGVLDHLTRAGVRTVAIQADISREADIVRLFEIAGRELGPLRALVNNAAITGGMARVEHIDAAKLANMLAVNVAGTMLCSREAVRRMSTRRGGSGGAIVNISSIAARTGSPGEWAHYAASKGAVDTFTVGLAREVAAEGIRANAVAPGLVDTGLHAANGEPERLARLSPTIPMQRAATPDEIAQGVLWLLSDAASYVTGTILEIGGGR